MPPSGHFTSKEASGPGEEGAEPDHTETGTEASSSGTGLQNPGRPLQRSFPCTLARKRPSIHPFNRPQIMDPAVPKSQPQPLTADSSLLQRLVLPSPALHSWGPCRASFCSWRVLSKEKTCSWCEWGGLWGSPEWELRAPSPLLSNTSPAQEGAPLCTEGRVHLLTLGTPRAGLAGEQQESLSLASVTDACVPHLASVCPPVECGACETGFDVTHSCGRPG